MKNLYILLLILFFSIRSLAQTKPADDYIFFAAGSQMKGKIESADDEKIKAILENGGRHTALRDKFLVFFNKTGNYLTEKNISHEPGKAQQQIADFYAETLDNKNYNDILIRAIPQEVITCTIKNELEDAVNYVTLDSKSGSINKDNLLAIIRRNGTFELLRESSEIVDNLTTLSTDFKTKRNMQSHIPEVPKPTAKPPVTVPANQTPPTNQTSPADQAPQPNPVAQAPEIIPVTKEKKRLTDEQQRIYKAKSVDKMEELSSLLNDIVDNRRSRAEKDLAIKKAFKMFIKDAKVEVSAINNPNNKTNRDVAEYLARLSRLNYSKVNITYAKINFIEEFEPDTQGDFWGLASYEQTFETNSFRDLTQKQQRIKLQQYEKLVDGAYQDKFEVLLGNISINVSQ